MSSNWVDIRDEIRRRVLERELLPGAKLPNDQELAEEFKCSRTTVQRAMLDLAQSGTVDRRRKGGTTITLHPITRTTFDIPITRLEIEAAGNDYSYFLVSREILVSPPRVASSFGLAEPTEMLRVTALHMANKQPYIFEDRWIAHETTPEILDVDLSRESANEWLIRNRPYSDCEVRFLAKRATRQEAELLASDVDEALFVMERTTWINGAPITMVRAIAKPGYQLVAKAN
ncbi:transcriptional regulator, GntR family [Ruegeria halocynthiae]|uniref:Transcriptional regulator, GntR family n=1 Tax=Ruegeria halocynthiae TaxID=985054 RepID=A0A1H3G2K6_9RHOB|nr:GntR family transcriptional regulator [Ruegeria halocynthiae]SDX97543.1 transcriptional regulator, GntR family [Ruegeria halocynthiae]